LNIPILDTVDMKLVFTLSCSLNLGSVHWLFVCVMSYLVN